MLVDEEETAVKPSSALIASSTTVILPTMHATRGRFWLGDLDLDLST